MHASLDAVADSGGAITRRASTRRNAMTVGVVIGRSPRRNFLCIAGSKFSAPLSLSRIAEILQILGRAADAAHHYERLRAMSDAALADRGLTREDIPRAALKKLTDDS
jgi:uncharacterized protein YjiS (DUF1127 family)